MENRERKIYKVTLIGSVVNAFLIVIKLLAGIFGRSSALIADGIHSLTDFISDIVVLVFVKISGKPIDNDHQYGHGKYETMATLLIGVILGGAGVGLLIDGIKKIVSSIKGEVLPEPTWAALCVALVSIVIKEILYRYTLREGVRLNSDAVKANAWHHRSDAFSSLGTVIGISGAMFFGIKWRILDPIAAAVVSIFIIKAGIDIIKPAVSELLESSLPKSQNEEIIDLIKSVKGVKDFHRLRTRKIGNRIAVDVHIKMDGNLKLVEAHNIASHVEQLIRKRFGQQSIVNIHMEPYNGPVS